MHLRLASVCYSVIASACVLVACNGAPETTFAFQHTAAIVRADVRPDGNFDVLCDDGSRVVVPASGLGQACQGTTPLPRPIPAVEVKTDDAGDEFCARYQDDTLQCWSNLPEGEAPKTQRPALLRNHAKAFDLAAATACAVTEEGSVQCWGSNGAGILNVPAGLASPGAAHAVAVGDDAACAIRSDGTVQCWGADPSSLSLGVPSDLGSVREVVAQGFGFCAIRTDGVLKCWGDAHVVYAIPADLPSVRSIRANDWSACAVLTAGGVRCWSLTGSSDNPVAQLPASAFPDATEVMLTRATNTACVARSSAAPSCWGDNGQNQLTLPSDLKPFSHIAIGSRGMCGVQNDGAIVCWNFGGVKTSVGKTHSAQFLVAKESGVCSTNANGDLLCWGRNMPSPLDPSDDYDVTFAMDSNVAGGARGRDAQSIALGGDHSCFLTDGYLQCHGVDRSAPEYVRVDDGENIAIVAGSSHTCSLRTDGVKCWGDNGKGQLLAPRTLSAVRAIAAGGDHTCVINGDGRVRCWGDNDAGQSTPPASLTNASALALGRNHSCAVSNGAVTCWGDDSFGQSTVPRLTQSVSSLVVGATHSCAILNDRSLRCWGSNAHGETAVPVIPGGGGVAGAAAGDGFTCAIAGIGGSVLCWGDNSYGQREVPSAALIGTRFGDTVGDRVFRYGATRELVRRTSDPSYPYYHALYQEIFAYAGLKGAANDDLPYDLTFTVDNTCLWSNVSASLGLAVLNGRSADDGLVKKVTANDTKVVEFKNLVGPSRVMPGFTFDGGRVTSSVVALDPSSPACSFTYKSVRISPSQNIPTVLANQARRLTSDLNTQLGEWLAARKADDVRRDGLEGSRANINIKKDAIVADVQNLLHSFHIAAADYGFVEWTASDIENGLFRDWADLDLMVQDKSVRVIKAQAEWPAWATALFDYTIDGINKNAGVFVAEQLLDYQSLIENLKRDMTRSPDLERTERTLKALVEQARAFLANTKEVQSTIDSEIRVLQQSALQSSDICKRSRTAEPAGRCE